MCEYCNGWTPVNCQHDRNWQRSLQMTEGYLCSKAFIITSFLSRKNESGMFWWRSKKINSPTAALLSCFRAF
jgi:hypothetical protein